MPGSFYDIGRLAGVQYRKARWLWTSVAGSEEDAIHAEHGVGRDLAAVVLEQAPAHPDPELQRWVDGITESLGRCVRTEAHQFSVTVISDPRPTAFALPGGFIFVAPALVELCDHDRDELAFAIAHEMAHIIKRHAVDRLLTQTAMSAASLASPAARTLAPWIRKVGRQWLERAYSRDNELQADELGGLLMRAAGFDPSAAVRLLRRFQALEGGPDGGGLGAYLSTHPATKDRISHLRAQLDVPE